MKKRIIIFVITIALAALLSAGGYILIWGMPVSGAPNPRDVQSVTVKYGEEPGGAVEYTDPEKIESACRLLGSMNYEPFTESSEGDAIAVTITYNMKDGSRKVAAANSQTGWWQGKTMKLKQGDVFVNVAEGLFPRD